MEAGIPPLSPAPRGHLEQCLRVLLAALPRRAADDLSGDLLVAAYRRKLGHMPEAQINFIADQALERCRWFPTIAELIEIGGEWQRDDEALRAFRHAETALFWEMQRQYDEAMAALQSQELDSNAIAVLPESWVGRAVRMGVLIDDGAGGVSYPARPAMTEAAE